MADRKPLLVLLVLIVIMIRRVRQAYGGIRQANNVGTPDRIHSYTAKPVSSHLFKLFTLMGLAKIYFSKALRNRVGQHRDRDQRFTLESIQQQRKEYYRVKLTFST